MKIKSLTMIGNECEIIESFVRYNSHFIDEMTFIYDTGCVDTTLEILRHLQEEGYPIILEDEALVSYEQKAIENKYLRILAKDRNADLIIPLDADEFISSDEDARLVLENLQLDQVYQIRWKNYVPCPQDNPDERFIPRRITHYRDSDSAYTKVIIPAQLVCENKVSLTTGHHGIESTSSTAVEPLSSLFIAHYPLISREQYQSKIYCNNIRYITWMNRGNGEGAHLNRLLAELEAGEDYFFEGVSVYDNNGIPGEIVEHPLELKYCNPERLCIRYPELAKVDVMKNLVKTAEIMALKAYNLQVDKLEIDTSPRILIYGTGGNAKKLMEELPERMINIRAFVDSHPEKKFTMFHRRIVVTPELVRCFPFDRILISSTKFYTVMKQQLIAAGIEENRIVGMEYILDLTIESLKR